jgi:predicted RNA binding protein YcfA (HicA-like mRNA interferase family)
MNSRELLRKLRRLGASVVVDRGKGGHVMVKIGDRHSFLPTGSREIRPGTFAAILRDLGIKREELN